MTLGGGGQCRRGREEGGQTSFNAKLIDGEEKGRKDKQERKTDESQRSREEGKRGEGRAGVCI